MSTTANANTQPIWFAIDSTTGDILAGPTTRRKAQNLGRLAAPKGSGVGVTSDAAAAHGRKAKIEASRARSAAFFAQQG
jgi:hypothetical protein